MDAFLFKVYKKTSIPKNLYLFLLLLSIVMILSIVIGSIGFVINKYHALSIFDILLNMSWSFIIIFFIILFMIITLNRYLFSKVTYIKLTDKSLVLPFVYSCNYPKKIKIKEIPYGILSIISDYSEDEKNNINIFNKKNNPIMNF
ncbi:MAG: hypothetical protein DRN57_09195, partial [Thermoplasmata archaeon]